MEINLSKAMETLVNTLNDHGVSFEYSPDDAKTYWHNNERYMYLVHHYKDGDTTKIKTALNVSWNGIQASDIFLEDNLANLSKACRDKRLTVRHEKNYGDSESAIVVNRK